MDFLSVREFLFKLRQARAMSLFNNMRAEAEKRGFLTEEEINSEIQKARAENFMTLPSFARHI